ncbi:MAG: hypothetical protein ACC612_07160 [Methanomethylovorans sp.]|jgi:hypothetical protein
MVDFIGALINGVIFPGSVVFAFILFILLCIALYGITKIIEVIELQDW